MNTKEISKKWHCKQRWVSDRCNEGMVPSATKIGKKWEIPEDAEKPPCAAGMATTLLENIIEIIKGNDAYVISPGMIQLGQEVIDYLSKEGFISVLESEGSINERIKKAVVLQRGINLISKTRKVSIEEVEEEIRLSGVIHTGIADVTAEKTTKKRRKL